MAVRPHIPPFLPYPPDTRPLSENHDRKQQPTDALQRKNTQRKQGRQTPEKKNINILSSCGSCMWHPSAAAIIALRFLISWFPLSFIFFSHLCFSTIQHCVLRFLDDYLQRAGSWRTDDRNFLFRLCCANELELTKSFFETQVRGQGSGASMFLWQCSCACVHTCAPPLRLLPAVDLQPLGSLYAASAAETLSEHFRTCKGSRITAKTHIGLFQSWKMIYQNLKHRIFFLIKLIVSSK